MTRSLVQTAANGKTREIEFRGCGDHQIGMLVTIRDVARSAKPRRPTTIGIVAMTNIPAVIAVPARDMTGAEFARSLGLNIRSPEQKAAEWRAECERFADYIEAGKESAVPPPCLWDARRIVEERAQLTECRGDPLLRRRA